MKQYIFFTVLLCLIMVFTPLICIAVKNSSDTPSDPQQSIESNSTTEILSDKAVQSDIKDLLIRTVAAQMPASYEPEALKAQAVAAYTYYRWLKENADNADLTAQGNGSVPEEALTDEELKEKWGNKYDSYKKKIEDAVLNVFGECIMYEGEPIMALTFPLSEGKTRSAKDVFGEDIPYLQSVNAVGDRLSPDFETASDTMAVGMSRYSADYMARQGADYKEILVHFFKGIYIDKIL